MWRFLITLLLIGCGGTTPQWLGHDFLGAPYVESPLGEASAPDSDPLIRFDAFDCTTFVETVLANGDQGQLNQIRYKNGEIGFLNRNHFIESDWLLNNSERVENVSRYYANTAIRNVIIDKKAWLKKVHGIDSDFESVEINLEYIPYEHTENIVIYKPMIVLFITDNPEIHDKIGTDLAVTHMGIVSPDGILRHASSEQKMVVDVPFTEYINLRKQNKNNIGIALVKIK
ncbi:MAG: DUF1460 domain-containing protein [Alphaproteobacteria bacterium]|nr:DUF1460 domain-containing protein [Alphaproteobacteria bacterium]